MWVYPENGNEISFGGTYSTNTTIFIGYQSKDNLSMTIQWYPKESSPSMSA